MYKCRCKYKYEARMTKYHKAVERSGFLFISAAFSHTGQIHGKFVLFVTKQINLKMQSDDPYISSSEIKEVVRFWIKQLSGIDIK